MPRIAEALESAWNQLSPALAIVLIALIVVVGILSILWFSIARIVWLHKHPSWTFKAAFDHLFQRSVLWLLAFALVVAAIWLLPAYVVPDSLTPDTRLWQAIATFATAILSNLLYYAFIVERIRRPRE